jgi:hypothetical protein
MAHPKRIANPRGARARRAGRRGHLRKWLLALPAVAALAGLFFYLWLGGRLTASSTDEARAAIVDQLSLTEPNPTFVDRATEMLDQAGYAVDYYPGDKVTVDFYRELPSLGYELLILRVHSAVPGKDLAIEPQVPQATLERILSSIEEEVLLFTSEPFDRSKYVDERRAMRLFPVHYYGDDPQHEYFAVTSEFVRGSMREQFDNATIVLMGCSGLAFDRTAAALQERGAGAVIGWSGLVSAAHTDAATERLLQHLLIDGLPTQDAVARTAQEVGPDPRYGSTLLVQASGG